jgi:hypothetical protein
MATIRLDDSDDVEDLALELGATVEYANGRKFNTAGMKALRKAKLNVVEDEEDEEEEAEEKRSPSAVDTSLLQQVIQQLSTALNRPVAVTLPEMPVPQVTVQAGNPVTPVSWVFEFERNPNGTIKRINATPAKG